MSCSEHSYWKLKMRRSILSAFRMWSCCLTLMMYPAQSVQSYPVVTTHWDDLWKIYNAYEQIWPLVWECCYGSHAKKGKVLKAGYKDLIQYVIVWETEYPVLW